MKHEVNEVAATPTRWPRLQVKNESRTELWRDSALRMKHFSPNVLQRSATRKKNKKIIIFLSSEYEI